MGFVPFQWDFDGIWGLPMGFWILVGLGGVPQKRGGVSMGRCPPSSSSRAAPTAGRPATFSSSWGSTALLCIAWRASGMGTPKIGGGDPKCGKGDPKCGKGCIAWRASGMGTPKIGGGNPKCGKGCIAWRASGMGTPKIGGGGTPKIGGGPQMWEGVHSMEGFRYGDPKT